MAEAFFVGDGYETDGKIPRAEGVHPELTFTYRPALRDERDRFVRQTADMDKRAKATAEFVCKHVQSWSVKDRDGRSLDRPTPELCGQLHPLLMDKLLDVVTGYAPSGAEATDRKNS